MSSPLARPGESPGDPHPPSGPKNTTPQRPENPIKWEINTMIQAARSKAVEGVVMIKLKELDELFEKIGHHLRVTNATTTTTTAPATIDTIAAEVRKLSSITATLVEQAKNAPQTSGITTHPTTKNATNETPTWATRAARNTQGGVYNIRPMKEKPVAKKLCELRVKVE